MHGLLYLDETERWQNLLLVASFPREPSDTIIIDFPISLCSQHGGGGARWHIKYRKDLSRAAAAAEEMFFGPDMFPGDP